MNTKVFWIVWLVLTLIGGSYLGYRMWISEDSSLFLIGETSHGHHQIEMACDQCHTQPFGGKEILQDACLNCHQEELKIANDSHPIKKFTDPRNADRLEILDARYCVTCHVEHNTEITHDAGLTLPIDFCIHCHEDIGEERDTHQGLGFETCANAGCHNFHDNRALYEDFLVKHAQDPLQAPNPTQPLKQTMQAVMTALRQEAPLAAIGAEAIDAPASLSQDTALVAQWAASQHADAGVNCSGCHQQQDQWQPKPDHTACQDCHNSAVTTFLQGKHGMRLAAELPALSVADARQPMHAEAQHKSLGCNSCHTAHDFDTQRAAVDACLGCHADEHSQSYLDSPHFTLWQQEQQGLLPAGQGVTCASCHIPRIELPQANGERLVLVQHNQNDTLRPNEKMIRSSCMQCHSLEFAIDALADPALIDNNFNGQPSAHIESIDMAIERDQR